MTRSRSVVAVEAAETATEELVDAVQALVPQVSRTASPPTAAQVAEIIGASGTTLLVARDAQGGIVGMLTLVLFRIPTGLRARLEDVVVDEAARGRGVGELLTREGLRLAGEAGARTVELTSHPSREAANRLYSRLGFGAHETNVYRYTP